MKQLLITLFLLLLFLAGGLARASFIDQACDVDGLGNGNTQIEAYSPLGQEFIPTVSGHAGVAVCIVDFNDNLPPVPVTVTIHEETIYGPVVPGSTVVRNMPAGGWEHPYSDFLFQEPVILTPGNTYVIEVSTENSRWGIRSVRGGDGYENGSMITQGTPNTRDLQFRTLGDNLSPLSSHLYCYPTAGLAPLTSNFSLRFWHDHVGETRTIAGHIDITLGNGQFVPNFRTGYTNVSYDSPRVVIWWLNLPAIYPVLGTNLFEIVAEDVTPAPYNQPPYAPSGDTDIDFTEIYIIGGEE